jgi:hypothetical protein
METADATIQAAVERRLTFVDALRGQVPHRRVRREAAADDHERPGILARASTPAGLGLMTSGQSGAFRALGPAGNAAAQTWNAGMSALGTWQHAVEGNANTGRVYRLPIRYPSRYELYAEP